MPARRVVLAPVLALAAVCSAALAQAPAATSAPTAAPQPPAYVHSRNTPLADRITALLSDPEAARAHWGIAVTALDGTPLYGLDETRLFRPASTAKLFTTAAALAVLGPDSTVTTSLTGDLDATTGILHGNLNLLGAGDPSFGSNDLPYPHSPRASASTNDLAGLADQAVARGLRHITGDVVGNDALLAHEPPPEGWAAEDVLWGYGALPSALSLADNEIVLTISPRDARSPAAPGSNSDADVAVQQLAPFVSIRNEVTTVAPGSQRTSIDIVPIPGEPQTLRVSGQIASGSATIAEHLAVSDPAQYAAAALKLMLQQRGVQVDGEAKALHAITAHPEPYLQAWRKGGGCGNASPGDAHTCSLSCQSEPSAQQQLASHTSAPLAQEVTFTLKTSANLHAELLLAQLGLRTSCPGSSAVHGAALIRTFLLHLGLADGDFVFYDGSGLSAKDLVTPRAEAQLLAYATAQPWFPQWKAALPLGGVDGTLASRFTGPQLKGRVFAKTGTLGESRALAGYVRCASGREVIFSVLVDNHNPRTNADRSTMDKIVEAIAALN